ncbi:MAG: histidine--tRNA ligase, partial [Romboutsia sp.]|nr:histidine--tRNA ligase [Romboutsia sp.]
DNGCFAIDTPIIEKAKVLLAKSGGETEKQVYEFQKGKNNLALRFDLTVPFARYVAQYYNDLVFPFKRYQIGKVYRGERNQRGRYREFYQCDIDIIGKEKLSIDNDAYVISLASKAFKAIGLRDYKFMINNRKILKGIMNELQIENTTEVMILIDKYDKISRDEFIQELDNLIGVEKSQYLNKVIGISGSNKQRIDELQKLNIQDEVFIQGLEELKKVSSILTMLGVAEDEFEINLKIIRGLDYYTGTVFETILLGNEGYGSICSGGRYDNLAEKYTNNVLPGVGISIGLTRLFFVLKEIGFIDNYKVPNKLDYLILPIGDTIEYCLEVMKYIQESGKRVSVYFEDDSLKKKMNYANKIGAQNVILIGEDEVKNNMISVKNMKTGESKNIDYKMI